MVMGLLLKFALRRYAMICAACMAVTKAAGANKKAERTRLERWAVRVTG